MIAIIDYGMGNLESVRKALSFLNLKCQITNNPAVIRDSCAIVLPGVGSFPQAMNNLTKAGLDEVLTDEVVVRKKKFLGICLGMQLVASFSLEHGLTKGLGWIDGKVIRIKEGGARVPHLGWNNIEHSNDKIFTGLPSKDFYFIHSFHLVPDNSDIIVATFEYGNTMVAGIKKDNILAFQFHPEKSQLTGMKLLSNYLS